MMKTKTSMWFAAAVAAGFAFGFAGCGGGGTMTPTTCSSDSACGASEVCHPLLKTCVTACTGSTDCPDSAKKCATITGASAGGDGGVRGFCQCSTDALCDKGTAGEVCQDKSTLVCAAKCTASAGCPTGFTCDTATGKCGSTASNTDGGTDAGVTMDAGAPCTPGSCTGGKICDPATRACITGAACATANAQPDSCAYGLFCSAAACAEAPMPGTCSNFDNVATPKAWNPATIATKGPVTHAFASITKDTGMPLFCGSRGADFSAEIRLYAPTGSTFPAMRDLVPANFFNYVRTDGQLLDLTNNAMPLVRATGGYAAGLSNNNKNLTMKMNLCVTGTAPASLVAGFFSENGNGTCATLQ
jgi:hypothetical protein